MQRLTERVQRRGLEQQHVQGVSPDLEDLQAEQAAGRNGRGQEQLEVACQEQVVKGAAQAGDQRQNSHADQ